DGNVYVSQPSTLPLLEAGRYDFSAVFNPVSGGGYSTSQTLHAVTLTVAKTAVAPHVTATYDAAVSERLIITASLTGEYVDDLGGAPAGTWHFTLIGPGD